MLRAGTGASRASITFPRAVLGYAPHPQPSPYSLFFAPQGLLNPWHTQNMNLQLWLCPSSWSRIATLLNPQPQIHAPNIWVP